MYKDKSEIAVMVSAKAMADGKEITIQKEIRVTCDRDTDFATARTGLCRIISFIDQIEQNAMAQAEAAAKEKVPADESAKPTEAKVEAIQ